MKEEDAMIGIAGMFKPFKKERHEHGNKECNTVREIFGKRYLCRHSDILTRHPDDLKTFGVRLTGHEDIDKGQMRAEVVTWCTIATMAHYLRLGVDIRIINYGDSRKIYEAVTDHIRAWRHNFSFSLNENIVPIEDLEALENLSVKVFPSARVTILKEGNIRDSFDKAIGKFNLVTPESLFVRDSYNKKHNIHDTTSSSIGSKKLEIVREDNSDYFLGRLNMIPGVNLNE